MTRYVNVGIAFARTLEVKRCVDVSQVAGDRSFGKISASLLG